MAYFIVIVPHYALLIISDMNGSYSVGQCTALTRIKAPALVHDFIISLTNMPNYIFSFQILYQSIWIFLKCGFGPSRHNLNCKSLLGTVTNDHKMAASKACLFTKWLWSSNKTTMFYNANRISLKEKCRTEIMVLASQI